MRLGFKLATEHSCIDFFGWYFFVWPRNGNHRRVPSDERAWFFISWNQILKPEVQRTQSAIDLSVFSTSDLRFDIVFELVSFLIPFFALVYRSGNLYLKKARKAKHLRECRFLNVIVCTHSTCSTFVLPSSAVKLISEPFDVVQTIENNNTIRRKLSCNSRHKWSSCWFLSCSICISLISWSSFAHSSVRLTVVDFSREVQIFICNCDYW